MSKTYLVTGGAGFIGSNIAEKLVNAGENVRVIDNLLTGKMENMDTFKDKIDFINGDIRSLDTVMQAMKGVDYVIHAAALKQVPAAEYNPEEFIKTNVKSSGKEAIDPNFLTSFIISFTISPELSLSTLLRTSIRRSSPNSTFFLFATSVTPSV